MNWIRALKNIPSHLNQERSDQLAYKKNDGYRWIFISREVGFACPKNWLVLGTWKFYAFSRGGRADILSFLRLAEGRTRLLDLGASAGIFSTLFLVSRPACEVVGAEPDHCSINLFRETMETNAPKDSTWRGERVLIGDRRQSARFCSTGFGGNVSDAGDEGEILPMESIITLCDRLDFRPDIIKIDIESYEYEALEGALDWLRQVRPRLFVELHWNMLIRRGKDPVALLRLLDSAGLAPISGKRLTSIFGSGKWETLTLPLDWKTASFRSR